MRKIFKLAIALFVGVDVFVLTYLLLAQARLALFGKGYIPGGGSAIDMALFLVPVLLGYIAGDRLYWFLSYKYKAKAAEISAANPSSSEATVSDRVARSEKVGIRAGVKPANGRGAWDEGGWTDSPEN